MPPRCFPIADRVAHGTPGTRFRAASGDRPALVGRPEETTVIGGVRVGERRAPQVRCSTTLEHGCRGMTVYGALIPARKEAAPWGRSFVGVRSTRYSLRGAWRSRATSGLAKYVPAAGVSAVRSLVLRAGIVVHVSSKRAETQATRPARRASRARCARRVELIIEPRRTTPSSEQADLAGVQATAAPVQHGRVGTARRARPAERPAGKIRFLQSRASLVTRGPGPPLSTARPVLCEQLARVGLQPDASVHDKPPSKGV